MVERPAVLTGCSNYLLEIRQICLLVIGVYDHIVNVKNRALWVDQTRDDDRSHDLLEVGCCAIEIHWSRSHSYTPIQITKAVYIVLSTVRVAY